MGEINKTKFEKIDDIVIHDVSCSEYPRKNYKIILQEQIEQEIFNLRQQLNTEEECCAMLQKKVQEFNKLIKILKEKFFIDIIERENDYKIGFLPKTPIVNGITTRFTQINYDEAKILKEFLDYE